MDEFNQQGLPDLYNALLGNYISYERLYAMTMPALYGDRDQFGEVNFFIDLNSYLKRLFDPRPFGMKADNCITASVINCCAHYRQYFWTRHQIKTNFYIVYGSNCPPDKPLEYNAHHRERLYSLAPETLSLMQSTLNQLTFLCTYLPEIYMIDASDYETAGAIACLMDCIRMNSRMTPPNIVLTKDAYAYQLVAKYPSTFIYRPKKNYVDGHLVDNSWVVLKRNLYKALAVEMGYKVTVDFYPNDVNKIDLVLALSGLKDRHIKGSCSYNKACGIIRYLEDNEAETISHGLEGLEYYFNSPNCYFKLPKVTEDVTSGEARARYDMLNLNAAKLAYLNSFTSTYIADAMYRLYDPQGVQELANKEFIEYPLELMEL